jgi:prepilin-type processing-associated H-X9-DG protein
VVLANLNRADVYDAWHDPATPGAQLNSIVLRIYQCPADLPADRNEPQLSYVANVGASTAVAESPANGVLLDHSAGSPGLEVRPGALPDGAATTLLLSENRQATEWPSTQRNEIGSLWHPTTTPLPEHRINQGIDLPLSEDTARPSSFHTGGVNAAFCDGHVQFLDGQLDYKIYMQLMTPDRVRSDMPAAWKTYLLSEGDF